MRRDSTELFDPPRWDARCARLGKLCDTGYNPANARFKYAAFLLVKMLSFMLACMYSIRQFILVWCAGPYHSSDEAVPTDEGGCTG